MKKTIGTLKAISMFIVKKRAIQYLLMALILVIPVAKVVNDKFFKYENISNQQETERIEEHSLAQGTINTEVEKAPDDNVSSYVLEDGFSEVENIVKPNNSSNNSPTVIIDKSSLNGRDITISEGDLFDAIKDLKLSATEKDGSDISSRIIIEENNVNTEKPGVYSVKASAKLNNGYKMERTFAVNVKATDLEVSVNSFKPVEDIVEKGENIILNLDIKSSKKYVKANAVAINGKEYPLYKANGSVFSALSNIQKYSVKVDAATEAGEKEYKLSYIRMSDNTLVNVDNTIKLEVLKTEAKIKNFRYEGESLSKRIYTKFELEDVDNSASNLKMEVYKNNEFISAKNLDKQYSYDTYVRTETNGVYEIKIIADINVNSKATEKNTILNKEIFSETINITNIDETSLTGNSIEIMEGQKFDPKLDLNLKATDVHGEDITDKIIIDSNNVEINKPGKYIVSAHIINKNNKKISRNFTVVVKEIVKDKAEDIESEVTTSDDMNNESRTRNRMVIARDVIQGDDTSTLNANVTINGVVTKSDGTAPDGKIQVEVPTSIAFAVNKSGELNSATFKIKNDSAVAVEVSVSSFVETKENAGITVWPSGEDLTNKDRSNIHLKLVGQDTVDLGEKTTANRVLTVVSASSTETVHLIGDTGKASGEEVDKNGANEDFNLVFKIKKKN